MGRLGDHHRRGPRVQRTPYDEYGSGPRRKVFLIFTVRVDGLALTSVYQGDFYVVTRNGTRIDSGGGSSFDAVNYDDTLARAEVAAGQHKTGYIVFDSPVRHEMLEYDPNFEGETDRVVGVLT